MYKYKEIDIAWKYGLIRALGQGDASLVPQGQLQDVTDRYEACVRTYSNSAEHFEKLERFSQVDNLCSFI